MAEEKVVPEGVSKYLYSLMLEKGLDKLPGNIQGDILYDLYLRYNSFLTANFLKALSTDNKEIFSRLVENDPTEKEIEEFFKEFTDYAAVIKETNDEFRTIYLS